MTALKIPVKFAKNFNFLMYKVKHELLQKTRKNKFVKTFSRKSFSMNSRIFFNSRKAEKIEENILSKVDRKP